jgi:hypothetical protein
MPLALRVTLTILGIVAIGRVLAAATPPEWKLGEFILMTAFIVLMRECLRLREAAQDLLRCKDPFAGNPAGFTRSRPEGPGTPDFEQAASSPRPAASEPKLDGSAEIRADDSVEHIAQVMVTQAFRKASLKYHPDHGGDPEIMRRVYAAREVMLRAIRKD